MQLNGIPIRSYSADNDTFTAVILGTDCDAAALNVSELRISNEIGSPETVYVGYNHIYSIVRDEDANTTTVKITKHTAVEQSVQDLNDAVDDLVAAVLGGTTE